MAAFLCNFVFFPTLLVFLLSIKCFPTISMTTIVPVLSPEDATALPTCAASLKHSGVKRLWLIHAPSLGVTNTSVSNSFDERLKTLKQKEQEAAGRGDYDAAKNFQQEAESVQIERDVAVKKGWEAVPEQERNAAYDKALAPLLDPKSFSDIKVTVLREDYQPDGLFGMMQGMMAQWPTDIQHGRYSIMWPQGCVRPLASEGMNAPEKEPAVSIQQPQKATSNQTLSPKEVRRRELSKYMKLRSVAKQHNIPLEGRPNQEVIEAVLAIEFPEAAAA